ncbi:50S ribosomal protein L3 [Microgenomates group bacterium]|nr:50S ribosomal protein L3 [Microgenomates group bacterium]
MLSQLFATKISMAQAWTSAGKRLPITKCKVEDNRIVSIAQKQVKDRQDTSPVYNRTACQIIEVAYGSKKMKSMSKPLKTRLEKVNIAAGAKQIKGIREYSDVSSVKEGEVLSISSILQVGDIVAVQGRSKGKGFAGVVKRHGFAGGPATHGQTDRERAPGSIGQGTTPGRVYKGHLMAGHMGDALTTVKGLIVVHIDETSNEIWLSGPTPGANKGILRLTKVGSLKKAILLNKAASGIKEDEKEKEETTTPAKEDTTPAAEAKPESEAPTPTDETKEATVAETKEKTQPEETTK